MGDEAEITAVPSREGLRARIAVYGPSFILRILADMSGPLQDGPTSTAAHEATVALRRLADGDSAAVDTLMPLVYDQLRALAGSYFRFQSADHTLQPTALVHEAFLKLVNYSEHTPVPWRDRAHFMAVAATAIRQILHDRARARRTAKRGGQLERVTLENFATPTAAPMVDLIALDDALNKLANLDPRQSRIVELRFFGGLTAQEAAEVLGLSTRTIEMEWRRTRAWLSAELSGAA